MWKRNRTVQRNVPCHVIVRKQPARHSKENLLKHWEDQKTARDEKKKKREERKLELMKQEERIQEWRKKQFEDKFQRAIDDHIKHGRHCLVRSMLIAHANRWLK